MIDVSLSMLHKLAEFCEKLVSLYGYDFRMPSRVIGRNLGICYVTALNYFALLEAHGIVKCEMSSRKNGARYTLSKRKVRTLIDDSRAMKELMETVL